MAATLTKNFNYYFHEVADKRVENWTFMKDPIAITLISASYLYFVVRCGPRYMENRPAYGLRRILQVYNIAQVAACIYLVRGFWQNGWSDKYTVYKCYSIDYEAMEGKSINQLHLVYWTTMLKLVEFMETIFFVLRKKQNQVTYLHLYHHVSTLYFMWMVTKYMGGGMVTFHPLLNSVIHIIMYTYYFLASLGPQWAQWLVPLKPKITSMQMIQFGIMIAHATLVTSPGCNVPNFMMYIFIVNVVINFAMFSNFFIQSYYVKKQKLKNKL